MKRTFRILTAAALGLAFVSVAQAQQTQSVGDLSSYFDEGSSNVAATAAVDNYVGDLDQSSQTATPPMPLQEVPATSDSTGPSYSSSPSYSTSYVPMRARRSTVSQTAPNTWLTGDTLLWFTEDRTSPLLAASSNVGEPVLPDSPGYTPLFGGELDSGMQLGFRGDAGRYFADGQIGFGGGFWFLLDSEDNFAANRQLGDRSLGVPFFDTSTGANNSLLIGRDPDLTGQLAINSSLDLWASQLYSKLLMINGKNVRVELLTGYSFFNIDDGLQIAGSTTRDADGRVTEFVDTINATNNFHGGQLGMTTKVDRGRFSFMSTTKVHLGNMNQRVNLRGASQSRFLGVPGETTFDRGVFVASENAGVQERDVFAFAPELNMKLGVRMRNYVNFTIGYSFIYWNNVALSGDQIDRNVDQTQIFTNDEPVNSPRSVFEDRGFFVHGLDLGITIDY